MHIGIIGHGTWLPTARMTAADLAAATGIPEAVIALKFGVKGKPVAGPGETTAFMGLAAARRALGAGVRSVHLVSGTRPDAILAEVFTNEGSGTKLVADANEVGA